MEELTHLSTYPLHVNPNGLDPCVSNKWIALPISNNDIGVWLISNHSRPKPKISFQLLGHNSSICTLSFLDGTNFLASSCRELILTWNLTDDAPRDSTEILQGEIFYENPGCVTCLSFNNNGNVIAASVENTILLLQSGKKRPNGTLSSQQSNVTNLKFCPHYSATLVSLSEDRTFSVWDVDEQILLYQTPILSSSPFISVSMSLIQPHMAVGSADGCVKIFDLTDGNDFRQLFSFDISSYLKRNEKEKVTDFEIESGNSVLSLQYIYFNDFEKVSRPFRNKKSGTFDVLSTQPPFLFIVSTNALLLMNSRSFEIVSTSNFHSQIKSREFERLKILGPVAYANLCQNDSNSVHIVVGTMFDNKTHCLHCQLETPDSNVDDNLFKHENSLNIISETELLPGSLLKSEMLPPIVSKTVTKGDIATGRKKQTNSLNQPLTFKNKIKSSGYSQAPRTTMFKPETDKRKLLNLSSSSKPVLYNGKPAIGKMLKNDYDSSKGPPTSLCDHVEIDTQSVAVLKLRFADDGSALACSLSDKSALLMKSPFSKHRFTSLIGHNNIVNSSYFNSSSSVVLTASEDKTASLWNMNGGDSLLSLSHERETKKDMQMKGTVDSKVFGSRVSGAKGGGVSKSSSKAMPNIENNVFRKGIKHAQFYYMDRFILLTYGPHLNLYKYFISLEKDEIKSYQSQSRYKIVGKWDTSSTSFTACTAVNTFLSQLVICATAASDIEIYDLNQSVLVHTFKDAHNRPAYYLTINEGSCFASQPMEAHNVIASVARNDAVKIWDLRTKSNVQSFVGHSNGGFDCQIAFSPCGNYLASGSEDKIIYIYDVRMGTYCERLRGHSDVVTSVAFHPAFPFLASGSIDSKILFFNIPKEDSSTQRNRQGGRKTPQYATKESLPQEKLLAPAC